MNKYLNNELTKKDYLFFWIVIPLILLVVFLLPFSLKKKLLLSTQNTSFIALFFSNYVHITYTHLLSNLAGYFVALFFVFYWENSRKRLYYFSFLAFIILPFVFSLINLYAIGSSFLFYGFSSISSAYTGYVLFIFSIHLSKTRKERLYFVSMVLVWNILIGSLFYKLFVFFLISFICLVVFIIFFFSLLKKIYAKIKEIDKHPGYALTLAFSLLSIVFLFPLNISYENSLTNIFVHYVGYLWGVFVPFIIDSSKN